MSESEKNKKKAGAVKIETGEGRVREVELELWGDGFCRRRKGMRRWVVTLVEERRREREEYCNGGDRGGVAGGLKAEEGGDANGVGLW